MIYIPAPSNKRLVWYLAMEEYVGQNIEQYPDGVFFTWVVDPTVIFGRHQVMAQEVNLDYCQEHGIYTYRRKSGGGCVYADRGNLMLSYVVPSPHAEQVFQQYLDDISATLTKIGLAAVKSEHNDILVDSQKVSGNACYALKKGTIVHGTMLYDLDFDQMQHAITPPAAKLEKHGVQSVRQRVRNLKPLLEEMADNKISDIYDLSDCLIKALSDKTYNLTAEDMAAIDEIETTYLNPDFLYDR
ncbi:MAG: lipoate--protein ligase family protein [Paludibacteraceae bacterium]|nr:lipoate--protein ligase family protein [Paludibacteraceae bacterium]